MPKTVTLNETQINTILTYLGGRPYLEVAGLISGIQEEWNKQNSITAVPVVAEKIKKKE